MASARTNDLRENLVNLSRVMPEPEWDFLVYCRFLAKRLPEKVELDAAEFGRLAEELITDLWEGVDRTTGETFAPPLVSGRSDLLYNFIRAKLRIVAEKVGGAEFAAAAAASAPPAAGEVAPDGATAAGSPTAGS